MPQITLQEDALPNIEVNPIELKNDRYGFKKNNFLGICWIGFSNSPHRWTDTQGCGVGLADVKLSPFIDITLFDTQT